MDARMRNSLDNWITGRYGEDQNLSEGEDGNGDFEFGLGIIARQEGKLISDCPFEGDAATAWKSGWMDEDSSQHVWELEPDGD